MKFSFLIFFLLVAPSVHSENLYANICELKKEKGLSHLSFEIKILKEGFYIHPDAPLSALIKENKNLEIKKPLSLKKEEATKSFDNNKKLNSLRFKRSAKASSEAPSAKVQSSFFLCSAKICEEQKNLSKCSYK